MPMTKDELKEAYPEILAELEQEAHKQGHDAGYTKGKEEGLATGAETERERIRAIDALGLPGHAELIQALKYDGKTTAGEAAVQWAMADKKVRETKLKTFKEETPPVVTTVDAPPDVTEQKDFNTLVADYQKEKGCSKTEAIKAIIAAHPEAHEKYLAGLKSQKKED